MWENETFTAMQNCFRQINFFKENEKVVFTKFLQQIGRTQCAKVHTVWKNEKFGLTEKIFRQINILVIYLVKP